ncbi:hypothetical protein DFJ43DRAFT_175611 [Lentinula guzmanii]|uniref:Uncharacterized protein n=1 Tax=Lentinula guzmanii TaxID=2804957 RepID=A0AA38JFL5_9AGAR|nr:hypothetical protein DFJ43DRAFT_175611 [Lentinula guzmanii]
MMSADSALSHTSGTEPRHCFIPHIETCISFSLDIRRTLNLLRCEIDDEIQTAIQNFPIRKYVAVVRTYENIPFPGCIYHRAGLRLLQQVAPETDLPLNHSPFRFNNPPLWDGSYHVSCMDRIVCIPRGHFDYADAFVMTMYSDDPSYEDTRVARAQQAKANGSSQTEDIVEDLCPSSPSVRKVVEEAESLDNSSRENRSIEPSSLLAQSAPRSDTKALRFYKDRNTVRLEEAFDELSDECFIGSESDADSQSAESWFSAEEGFSTDEGENNSLNDSHYIDDTIPLMNHISKVSTSFDGYNADGSIVPVVNFSLDLSGIPSLLSVDEYSKDYDMLDALVRKCRESSTPANVEEDDGEQSGSSLLCIEGALDFEQSTTSSTTSETSHNSLKEASNECAVSNTDLGASKQAKRSKPTLKSSRVGRFLLRVFSKLNTGK